MKSVAIAQQLSSVVGESHLYVAPSGSDSNDGSQNAPFRTIQKAANIAKAGTTVTVLPGVYAESVRTRSSGSAAGPIRFVSKMPGAAVIRPTGAGGAIWAAYGDHLTIEGFEVDGSASPAARIGIWMAGAHVYVQHNKVHHIVLNGANDSQGGGGIVLGGSYFGKNDQHAIGNVVHHVGTPSSDRVNAIYHQSTGSIVNNLVVSNPGCVGILLWHDARNIIIANNTVLDNAIGISVGAGDFYQPPQPADHIMVVNNLVYDNRAGGIREHGLTGPNNTYANDLVFGNGKDWFLQNGLTHQDTISGDPRLLNYERGGGGNYDLSPSSPAIDKGGEANAPRYDIEGRPRPYGAAPDIGAYEWRPIQSPRPSELR